MLLPALSNFKMVTVIRLLLLLLLSVVSLAHSALYEEFSRPDLDYDDELLMSYEEGSDLNLEDPLSFNEGYSSEINDLTGDFWLQPVAFDDEHSSENPLLSSAQSSSPDWLSAYQSSSSSCLSSSSSDVDDISGILFDRSSDDDDDNDTDLTLDDYFISQSVSDSCPVPPTTDPDPDTETETQTETETEPPLLLPDLFKLLPPPGYSDQDPDQDDLLMPDLTFPRMPFCHRPEDIYLLCCAYDTGFTKEDCVECTLSPSIPFLTFQFSTIFLNILQLS